MTLRQGVALSFVLVLDVMLGGCAPGASEDPVRPPGDRVTAVVMPFLAQMPLHIARAEGFFQDEGLEVEFLRVGRSQDLMAGLARGEVDVVAGLLTVNELNAIASGVRVRAIAALAAPTPGQCTFLAMIARPQLVASGALEDPDRLRGLVYDTDPLVPLGYQTDLVLRRHGLSLDAVEVVNLPPPAGLDAMRRGSIDVILENEPFVTRHLQAGTAEIWTPIEEVTPGYPHSVVLYGGRLLDRRRDLGERFAIALLRGIREFREGKTDRNMAIVREASGLSDGILEAACWPSAPAGAEVNTAAIRGYQEWSVERGLLGEVLPDGRVADPDFMLHATRTLER